MSYRNDVEALELQRTQLEERLQHLRDDRKHLESVVRDEPKVVAELDRIRTELHQRAPRRLPLLDKVEVASPCHERWDSMVGDEHARFCGRCEKNVYNLSSMTREAAEALLVAREGRLCVRYYSRSDGTIITADCPVGVRRKRMMFVVAAGAVAAMAASVVAFTFARMGDVGPRPAATPPPTSVVQGGATALPETPPHVIHPARVETMGEPTMGDIAPMQGQTVAPAVSENPPVPANQVAPQVQHRPRMGRPIMRHEVLGEMPLDR